MTVTLTLRWPLPRSNYLKRKQHPWQCETPFWWIVNVFHSWTVSFKVGGKSRTLSRLIHLFNLSLRHFQGHWEIWDIVQTGTPFYPWPLSFSRSLGNLEHCAVLCILPLANIGSSSHLQTPKFIFLLVSFSTNTFYVCSLNWSVYLNECGQIFHILFKGYLSSFLSKHTYPNTVVEINHICFR